MAQFGDRKEYKKCRFGVIDEHNRTIIPFEYQFIEGFENGVSVAIKNDKIGKIDTQGKVVEKFVPKPKTKPKERRNYIWNQLTSSNYHKNALNLGKNPKICHDQ